MFVGTKLQLQCFHQSIGNINLLKLSTISYFLFPSRFHLLQICFYVFVDTTLSSGFHSAQIQTFLAPPIHPYTFIFSYILEPMSLKDSISPSYHTLSLASEPLLSYSCICILAHSFLRSAISKHTTHTHTLSHPSIEQSWNHYIYDSIPKVCPQTNHVQQVDSRSLDFPSNQATKTSSKYGTNTFHFT
jgi:hypothetical protein